jgi:hypothetical protein
VRPDVQVCGIEIEPERVRAALPLQRPGLSFHVGGFEIPVPGRPVLVRAFNVLRQYEEADVRGIWRLVQDRLAADGLFIDGTCDEIGRRVRVGCPGRRAAALSLSISSAVRQFRAAVRVAERLPKALIHRNVPGEPVHALMQAMDRFWLESAPLAAFGNRQRWQSMCRLLRDAGWPVQDGPARWRLGELDGGLGSCGPARLGEPD